MSFDQLKPVVMRHLPSSSALKAFEAAGRHLSFLQAAEELNVTAGAVSRQIQSLEAFLGRRLFLRHNRRVELTPSGRAFLAEIQGPLRRIADAAARQREANSASTVSILAYPTFAIRWLIPRWGSLHELHPQIDIRLTTSLNPVDFERGEYDMAIQTLREGERLRGLCVHKLIDVVTFPVCSPELARRIRGAENLRRHTLLHGEPRPEDWRQWLQAAGLSHIAAGGGLRFESTNLAFHAAIEGLGVAIGIEALIREDLEQGRLVRLFDVERRSGNPLQLVYPEGKAEDANLISVRDWLLDQARHDAR